MKNIHLITATAFTLGLFSSQALAGQVVFPGDVMRAEVARAPLPVVVGTANINKMELIVKIQPVKQDDLDLTQLGSVQVDPSAGKSDSGVVLVPVTTGSNIPNTSGSGASSVVITIPNGGGAAGAGSSSGSTSGASSSSSGKLGNIGGVRGGGLEEMIDGSFNDGNMAQFNPRNGFNPRLILF